MNFRKETRGGNERIWNISLYNAYNSMNPNITYLATDYNKEAGRREFVIEKVTVLPILTSFSYTLKF